MLLMCLKATGWVTDIVDPDQMQHVDSSFLGISIGSKMGLQMLEQIW